MTYAHPIDDFKNRANALQNVIRATSLPIFPSPTVIPPAYIEALDNAINAEIKENRLDAADVKILTTFSNHIKQFGNVFHDMRIAFNNAAHKKILKNIEKANELALVTYSMEKIGDKDYAALLRAEEVAGELEEKMALCYRNDVKWSSLWQKKMREIIDLIPEITDSLSTKKAKDAQKQIFELLKSMNKILQTNATQFKVTANQFQVDVCRCINSNGDIAAENLSNVANALVTEVLPSKQPYFHHNWH